MNQVSNVTLDQGRGYLFEGFLVRTDQSEVRVLFFFTVMRTGTRAPDPSLCAYITVFALNVTHRAFCFVLGLM
jgi:hypothetical protein